MAKDDKDKPAGPVERAVTAPYRGLKTVSEVAMRGSITPDPKGREGLTPGELAALKRGLKPRPKRTPAAAEMRTASFRSAVMGGARKAAKGFDDASMQAADKIKAAMRRRSRMMNKNEMPGKPELRE